jgi:hypothetical protein
VTEEGKVSHKEFTEARAGYGGHNIQKQPFCDPCHVTSSKSTSGGVHGDEIGSGIASGEAQGERAC